MISAIAIQQQKEGEHEELSISSSSSRSSGEDESSGSELSEREAILNNLDESFIKETSVSSEQNFTDWCQNQLTKKQLRSSRIAAKENEKKEIVETIREQQADQQNGQQLKMMQKTMNMFDETDSQDKDERFSLNTRDEKKLN